MSVYSTKEVSLMVDIPYSTMSTYLGHYSFDKFRIGNKYQVCNEFYSTLIKYLWNKKNYKYIRNVERLIND
jgi:hypothetical protein